MRELTKKDLIPEFELNMIDDLFDTKMPILLRQLLKEYAGYSIEENVYIDPFMNLERQFHAFNRFPDIYGLAKEFKEKGWGEKICFGFDPGGWHYCIDMSTKDYGKVFLNRWTDFEGEDQFVLMANDLQQFIDGLHKSSDEGF